MATSTYTPLATTTLANNTTTYIEFTSISGNYTDLVLIWSGQAYSATGNYLYLQFNGDTGTNYSTTYLTGNGSAASSGRFANRSNFNIDYNANPINGEITNRIIQLNDYSNSTTYKTGIVRSNRASGGTDAIVGLWRSTSAITTIKLTIDQNYFASGTTFTLYGIKAG